MADRGRLMLLCAAMIGGLAAHNNAVQAQVRRTSTPIVVSLVTPTPDGAGQFAPTVTVSPTATEAGQAALQARESAGRVNVRALPDTNSELLGTISYGTQYPMLRRYYLWYELEYELSPNRRAWVFSELVEIDGDPNAVPSIFEFPQIAVQPGDDSGADSREEIAGESRIVVIETREGSERSREAQPAITALPTFTYPADAPTFAASVAEPASERELDESVIESFSNLPPLFPVMLLAGFGIVGILISFIRR